MFIPFFSLSLRFSSPRLDSTLHSMHRATSTTASYVHLVYARWIHFPLPPSTLYLDLSILVPIHRGSCTWLLHGSVATGTPVHPDNGYPTWARQKTVGACERHWFSAFNEVRGSQGIEEVAFHWLFHLAKRWIEKRTKGGRERGEENGRKETRGKRTPTFRYVFETIEANHMITATGNEIFPSRGHRFWRTTFRKNFLAKVCRVLRAARGFCLINKLRDYAAGKRERKKERNSAQAHGKWRNSWLSYRVAVLRVPVLVLKLPCTSGYAYELRSFAVTSRATNVAISRNKPSVLSRRSSVNRRANF